MPDSAKRRSTDMVNLCKSRPVRSTTTSSQSTENSINKPAIQTLTNKVNTFDTAVEGLSTQRTEEESAASDSLSKATSDPFLLPVQGLAHQKTSAFPHRGPSTIRRFFRRSRLRKNASNRLSVRIESHMRHRRLTLQNQSS